ncbi:hypothetical protein D3272_19095 [Lichenibacterium ramalinae]|uniref:Uncharacterized protein n=1 Tax=Lichenibacterium ramalinae TaxID=2316527 RepID=A0A4Q2R809_9HYPH|nr:hypothetical protein D3272_19095 [Lichenibacterium ramalinae]
MGTCPCGPKDRRRRGTLRLGRPGIGTRTGASSRAVAPDGARRIEPPMPVGTLFVAECGDTLSGHRNRRLCR